MTANQWLTRRRNRTRVTRPLHHTLARRFLGLTGIFGVGVGSYLLLTATVPAPDLDVDFEAPDTHVTYPDAGPSSTEQKQQVARLTRRYRCSTTGLEPDAVPYRAIVRDPDGTIRTTTFDEGWAMFKGDVPGTFVAVCAR